MLQNLPSTSSLLAHRADTINLAAGPSTLPTPVLLQATAGLLDYNNTGIGLTELSHRSGSFQDLVKESIKDLRTLLQIPDNFEVLYMQGGGLTQFATVPLNLVNTWKELNRSEKEPICEYIVTGSWSLKAVGEAKRLGCKTNIVVDGRKGSKDGKTFGEVPLPSSEQWNWSQPASSDDEKPAFIYYCSNETVNGIEIQPPQVPAHLKDVPIVSDMSSNILSRPIPWSSHNFGLIYAGAQKNIGPSGLTIVIIRKDLITDPDAALPYRGHRIPSMLSYKSHADAGSLYNTPPMFPIYVAGLVFKHVLGQGGIDAIEEINKQKAESVYKTINESNGFYEARVVDDGNRSRMNICFGIPGEGREARFIAEADKAGIKQIKGHRWVLSLSLSVI